ncbi:methyltransferase [Peptoniphilus equinus]|uniref:Methyltransferase n=1 Tax=Peptoniphilus equinus TaxID=3016343 RepID=A0ABY7QWP4_9FIRM|nr:methyltransferase [Peptoniphilus equinus]WBW50519.1 methyltransferase [Peptoniphilus equinus]
MNYDRVPGTALDILQDDRHFKYTLDALALSAFARARARGMVADLGAGTGILGFRLLDRVSRLINVEQNEAPYRLLCQSTLHNGVAGKIENLHDSITCLKTPAYHQRMDVVITNPPYYAMNLKTDNDSKNFSKHQDNLELFLEVASYVLKDRGYFYLVFPTTRLVDAMAHARQVHLEPKRLVLLQKDMVSEPKRFLMECVKGGGTQLRVTTWIMDETKIEMIKDMRL